MTFQKKIGVGRKLNIQPRVQRKKNSKTKTQGGGE